MIGQVSVSGLTFFAGCSAALDEKTVLLNLQWTGGWTRKSTGRRAGLGTWQNCGLAIGCVNLQRRVFQLTFWHRAV